MTNWINTTTFFLEPKEKMESLLKELFNNGDEFSPYIICPVPDTEKTEDEIWKWKAHNWGFTKYTLQSYCVYDRFSVIDFETNSFAALIFREFSKKHNLKYISYLYDFNTQDENLYFFESEENNFNITFDFSSFAFHEKDFHLFNFVDFSKLNLGCNMKDIKTQHQEKLNVLFSSKSMSEQIGVHKLTNNAETIKTKKDFSSDISSDDGW